MQLDFKETTALRKNVRFTSERHNLRFIVGGQNNNNVRQILSGGQTNIVGVGEEDIVTRIIMQLIHTLVVFFTA